VTVTNASDGRNLYCLSALPSGTYRPVAGAARPCAGGTVLRPNLRSIHDPDGQRAAMPRPVPRQCRSPAAD
jgi:hypothetical protein